MEAAAIGAILQGIGALGSASGNRTSGTDFDSSMWRQEYYAPRIAAATMEAQVNQARALGLHGSLGLGTSFGQGPSATPLGRGDKWAGIGEVGRVVSQLTSRKDRETARYEENLRRGMLINESQKSYAEARQAEVQVELMKAQLGKLLGPIPLWVTVMGDSGPVKVLNPELANSFQEGAGWMTSGKWLRGTPKDYVHRVDPVTGRQRIIER